MTAGIAGDVVHLEAGGQAVLGDVYSYALAEVPSGDNLRIWSHKLIGVWVNNVTCEIDRAIHDLTL